MHPQTRLASCRRKLTLQLALLASLAALCGVGLVSGSAQSSKEEREIVDKIPTHLPIKVKVRNLEKVKDLKNDQWMRDVEIEIKNTGTKPIYFLRLDIFFIDVERNPGEQIGYFFRYGRPELIDFAKRPTPEDVPIKPGETHVFKMPESYAKGWSNYKTREKKPHPKKVGLRFHELGFGDGTGFRTTGGLPVPNKSSCVEEKEGKTTATAWRWRPPGPSQQFASFLPAGFRPVNFYLPEMAEPTTGQQLKVAAPARSVKE